MTVLEVIALLNLLAVVIFGVINITKRNNRPRTIGSGISPDSKSLRKSPQPLAPVVPLLPTL